MKVEVARLRVLIIADRTDAPFRYRCIHAALQLRAAGALANVVSLSEPELPLAVARYSVIVAFRLRWDERVERVVGAARRAGVPLIFDCDDLIFDERAVPLLPFVREDADARAKYSEEVRAVERTFRACDAFVGSTPALADWAARAGKPSHVHPNVVPDEYFALAPRLASRERSGPTIGYFAGSNTHDLDFGVAVPALRRVLETQPGARLILGGFLDAGVALSGVEQRVVRLPFLSHRTLPIAYAACDVTIAPIAEINAFTDGKSALKFFEPGALGIPVVATPIAAMRAAIVHGESGFLADDERAWVVALELALESGVGRRVGGAAARSVAQEHSSRAVAGRLSALLGSRAVRAIGPEPPLLPLHVPDLDGRTDLVTRALSPARRFAERSRLRAALDRPVTFAPSPTEVQASIESALAGVTVEGTQVLIAGSPRRSGWYPASDIEDAPSSLGESAVTGDDPAYLTASVDLGGRRFRWAALRLRATALTGTGHAQLFWQGNAWREFGEAESARVSIVADGADHDYLLDLGSANAAFPTGQVRFRLDPLDRPGSVRVLALVLLADAPLALPAVAAPDATSLPAASRASRALLRSRVGELAVDESVAFASQRRLDHLRPWLRRRLDDTGCQLERIESASTGTVFRVARVHPAARRPVDVVVPVFDAREHTLRCLRSVLRHARGEFRLVVVDDASTDVELKRELVRLRDGDRRVVLLENSENRGFVFSANRGFSHATGRDVLLLNSDTQVFRGFLRRIQAAALADEETGIVSPLSNNATICSVPDFCRPNQLPPGLRAKDMARLVQKCSRRTRPELVTPVGFCMYVKREVLDRVGVFDPVFGRGFGEENDLGERAKAAGFRLRLCDDVYVWHEGSASFGMESTRLKAENAELLEARHPGYHAAVAHYVEKNPLSGVHDEIRFHLRRAAVSRSPALMLLLHASPFDASCGGTEWVVRDLVRELALPRVVIAYPESQAIVVAEVLSGDLAGASRFRFRLHSPLARRCHEHAELEQRFGEILRAFGVGHVHVHHLLGWPLSLRRVLRRSEVPYSLTLHDFYAVCPSPNLLDVATSTSCCPERCRDREATRECLAALYRETGEPLPVDPVRFASEHRAHFRKWLAGARQVWFPSASTRAIVESVYGEGGGRHAVLPHAYIPRGAADEPLARGSGRLRVALLGEVAYPSKGAKQYLEVMKALSGQPIEWHVFGRTDRFDFDTRLSELGVPVTRHGAYARDEIVGLLRDAQIDVGLLLPIWPETFSLTLSELLAAEVPVVAARQGALADRLSGADHGFLVGSAKEAADVLVSLAREGPPFPSLAARRPRPEEPRLDAWLAAQRSVYALGERPDAELSPRDYELLAGARVTRVALVSSAATPLEPAARHRGTRWYRAAERLKPYLPESVRSLARRALSDERLDTLQRFRFPSRRVRPGPEVILEARYLGTARFSSLGPDPSFYLQLDPVSPRDVGAFRFDVWCSNHGYTYAQIYFRHARDSGFSEHKSLSVELAGTLGDWQSFVVHLDEKLHPAFFADERLVELRFDPVNYAGVFGVGGFALCARRSR